MINKKDYMNEVKFSKQDKELYDMAWNAAIEAAALVYTKHTTENPTMVLDNLRKLKK